MELSLDLNTLHMEYFASQHSCDKALYLEHLTEAVVVYSGLENQDQVDDFDHVDTWVYHGKALNKLLAVVAATRRVRALNANQLLDCHELGYIKAWPKLSSTQLEKLAQENSFVKILAVLQVLSLIVQLISPKVSNLPSSPLEIAVLAFAASSTITYILYWGRPRGVRTVTVLKATRLPDKPDIDNIIMSAPSCVWIRERFQGRVDTELDLMPMPNDANSDIYSFWIPFWLTKLVSRNTEVLPLMFGAVFGGSLLAGYTALHGTLIFQRQGKVFFGGYLQ
jgi:hypothetical protein